MVNENKSNIDEEIEVVDVKNILIMRQWLYDFLGKSFYKKPKLEELKDIDKINIFGELQKEENSIEGSGMKILSDFFKESSKLTDKDIDKLNIEYNRLFVGPGHLLAPPWESVYRSVEKIIFDEHTLDVREFYKKWGVNNKRVNKEPDDHIGFELEFMSILTSKSIDALEENNMELFKETILGQVEFLDKHILIWIDDFIENILKNTNEEFFKGLGLFTLEYINMDKELLNDIANNIDLL